MFSCRTCNRNDFTIEQMKKEKFILSNKRGICKSCCTKYERTRMMIVKAERDPKNHLTCDNCDRIFSIKNTGNYTGKNQYNKLSKKKIVLRTFCPFCKSEDISRY